MSCSPFNRGAARRGPGIGTALLALAWLCVAGPGVAAAPTAKLQGKLVGTDNGEPIGFADVLLIPADTTLRRVGGLTNADGTFLLEAGPGLYTLQFRALSYATKRIEGIRLKAGELLPFDTGLTPEAIQQEEVIVEARARQNTESALLNARKRAPSVSDAVSAELVRRSPDKDAAEVLRRVTGLSVSDGKYVFVRGLGERYSSTEVDGVRIASPEQNKRVVPLDLVPANLLDHITVQKTYTADRPGEFGGGDVQVRTRDFPGQRVWSFSVSQGFADGVTFKDRRTYASGRADVLGYGASLRGMPDAVDNVVIPRATSATRPLVAELGKAFSNVWSTTPSRTLPNASYSATYGDELRMFGRSLGVVQSWSLARSFDTQEEVQRFFQGSLSDTLYDYAVTRWTESVQLGGLSALSYRLSPRHSLHLRGIYTNSADDEVRIYQGKDHNSTDLSGAWQVHRNTRLLYVQRSVLSGVAEGRHELPALLGAGLDWKLGRSSARRQQPDRREITYDRQFYFEGDTAHWTLASRGLREFGDLRDEGWGTTISGSLPYRLGRLGSGKLVIGYDRQVKERKNFYRRFLLYPNRNVDREAPPESLFAPEGFDGSNTTAYVEDATLNDPLTGLDNYRADQRVSAGFVSLDVPLGRRARANLGVRLESGFQNVRSYALFEPQVTLAEGMIDERDWLPSANLTWSLTEAVNLRLAASRTVSRPDLNELSPSPFLEYEAGMLIRGSPDLRRAMLDNYDVRIEAFPGLGEVLAVGAFYKRLRDPIEQTIVGGTPMLLVPRNSGRGRNLGLELEARAGLGRVWRRLRGLSVNANASFISSEVELPFAVSKLGSEKHPLQGQADYLLNGALSYTTQGGADGSLLLNATGKRLSTLAVDPLPDIYHQPFATLDATVNFSLLRAYRVKMAAKNLLDPRRQSLQGEREAAAYRAGRSYSIALTYGS
jgi:outer membrane receptor protein involved in Fe transport